MGQKKIRLALMGVGNCSASLVEGIQFYKNEEIAGKYGGLMHYDVGGYEPGDIQVVLGFDIDSKKVGRDVSEAIREKPNCAFKIADVPFLDAPVLRGPTLDGAPEHLRHYYGKEYYSVDDNQEPADVVQALVDYKVDIILINLPTGSAQAARFYVDCAKKAGCGVVNGIPEFLASDPAVAAGCAEAGIPILGDDWKSQIGATIIHRALAKLFEDRGIRIDKSYQLNFAGNTDFINLVMRGESKHVSKHDAISSILQNKDTKIAPGFAFVDNQGDQKTAQIYMEGAKFGNAPVKLLLHLEVEDSPNSGGISIDAVRCCMLARERGISGAVIEPSSYFFKHPPVQYIDEVCKEKVDAFIRG